MDGAASPRGDSAAAPSATGAQPLQPPAYRLLRVHTDSSYIELPRQDTKDEHETCRA